MNMSTAGVDGVPVIVTMEIMVWMVSNRTAFPLKLQV